VQDFITLKQEFEQQGPTQEFAAQVNKRIHQWTLTHGAVLALKDAMTDPRDAVSDPLRDALLTHAPVAVIVLDRNLKIIRVNEAFHRMTGHGDEVQGNSPFEFLPEPLLSESGLTEKLPRVRDEGIVVGPEEIRYRTPDGRPVVFWHKVFPVRGTDGAVAFVVALLQDWTEREQAAQRLRETVSHQEALLRETADTHKAMLVTLEELKASTTQAKKEWEATFDAITHPLFVHDQAFRIVQANRAYAEAAGMPRAEVIGRRYFEVFPKMEGPCRACRNAGESQEEEVFVSPSAKTYRMWAYPLRGVQGDAFTIHIMEDITERKRAGEELIRLASFPELNPDPVIECTFDGVVTYCNPAAREKFPDLAALGSRHPLLAQSASLIGRSEGKGRLSLTREVAVERTIWEEQISLIPAHNRLRIYAHEITERKLMEQQARRLQRLAALGQLLGGIAHELKNPLFVLTGRLQLLREKLAHRDYNSLGIDLEKIEGAAHRMSAIAQRFLFLARPTQPRQELCSVQEVLQEVLDFLDNELVRDRIHVVRTFAPGLPEIRSDPRQLHEVFLNLMLNAMQAMAAAHGQGTLTVETKLVANSQQRAASEDKRSASAERWIEVRIQDDGPGIPPEHRAKLFEPFFSTKPPEQGTGLGLWIVRSTLTGLGGTVSYETEVGQGSTFIVRLPVTTESGRQSAGKGQAGSSMPSAER
jgi:PAS domain S-box-containing protein